MKKLKYFLYFLFLIFITSPSVKADLQDALIVNIQYDWLNKSLLEKESIIAEIKDIMFENGALPNRDTIKNDYSDRLKDKKYKEHYLAASAGHKEYQNYNISAFYYKKQKHIYMYSLQDKEDLNQVFYYDALGKLRYIDFHYGEYPDYPYQTIQYNMKGKPISALYYLSKDNQYLYNPDGTFKGVWYKNNLYDEHSKIILKRSTY